MSLDFEKLTYVDGETVIPASNLNDIQDALLDLDENKVEKEQGKGLSTNDYTNAEKQKVEDAYVKPVGGIPDTDLSESVQASLEKADTAAQETDLATKAPAIYDTASGAVASFEDGADGMPLKSLTVNIEPVQAGSGDPSPDNVRPISGWTECNVTRTGVNVWDEDWELGYFDINGEPQPSPSHIRSKNYIPVISGGTYYFSKPNDVLYLCQYDKEKHFTERTAVELTGMVTMKPDTEYVRFNLASSYGATYNHDVSINYPSADTSYHPYQGNTYPISWQTEAGTVYGGTIDVTNGVLMVDRAMVDLGSLNWTLLDANKHLFRSEYIPTLKPSTSASQIPHLLSDKYKTVGASTAYIAGQDCVISQGIVGIVGAEYIIIVDTAYSDVTSLKTAITGSTAVYELATPIEITLMPTEVITLLGQNNIWADTGDVSVDYPCDTKLYIERINAPTDDDMIADTQIASGKYFLIGNTLYLSTTTIPAGDTIIPGTNCQQTNLAEALNALNT